MRRFLVNKQRGWSLIEILVVLGLAAYYLLPMLGGVINVSVTTDAVEVVKMVETSEATQPSPEKCTSMCSQ
jgi:type II secretory pathway pseudopilin PulG